MADLQRVAVGFFSCKPLDDSCVMLAEVFRKECQGSLLRQFVIRLGEACPFVAAEPVLRARINVDLDLGLSRTDRVDI